jgi:hypothetical protein
MKRENQLTKKGKQMETATFWNIVEQIGWGTKTTDYDSIKARLMRTFTVEQVKEFRKVFDRMSGRLYNVLDQDDNCRRDRGEGGYGLGDDGFGDLVNHIVGLGEKEFHAVLENPELAYERAQRYDYSESFSYCIPWDDDYEMLNSKMYVKRAKKYYEEEKGIYDADEVPVKYQVELENASRTFLGVVQMIIDGEFKKAVDNELTLIGAHEVLEKSRFVGLKTCWGVRNLISDLRRYYLNTDVDAYNV